MNLQLESGAGESTEPGGRATRPLEAGNIHGDLAESAVVRGAEVAGRKRQIVPPHRACQGAWLIRLRPEA